jgi:hypothetical protein
MKMRKFHAEGLDDELTNKQLLGRAFGTCRSELGLKKRDFARFSDAVNDFLDPFAVAHVTPEIEVGHVNGEFESLYYPLSTDFASVMDVISERQLSGLFKQLKALKSREPPAIVGRETASRMVPERLKPEEARQVIQNFPFTPVASSNVKGRSVDDKTLFAEFHDYDGVYRYKFPTNREAVEAFKEMVEGSPGKYVWEELRGNEDGPVFGKPNKITPGGTNASKVPYDKMGPSGARTARERLGTALNYEKTSETSRTFKTTVKQDPTSPEPFEVRELKEFQKNTKQQKVSDKKNKDFGKLILDAYDLSLIRDTPFDDLVNKLMKQKGISREEAAKQAGMIFSAAKRKSKEKKKDDKKTVKSLEEKGFKRLKIFSEKNRKKAEQLKDIEERMRNKEVALVKGKLESGTPIIHFMERTKEKPKKTVQKKIPVEVKGTGERKEPFKEKKTKQQLITEVKVDKPRVVEKAKERVRQLKQRFKDEPENREKWLQEIRKTENRIKKAGGKVFPFIPPKGQGLPGKRRKIGKPTKGALKSRERAAKAKKLRELTAKIRELNDKLKTETDPTERRRLTIKINAAAKDIEKLTGQEAFSVKDFVRIAEDVADRLEFGLVNDSIAEIEFNLPEFNGAFTRSGPFAYQDDNGKWIILNKDPENLKEVFNDLDYVRVIGSYGTDSHLDVDERIIGVVTDWIYVEPGEEDPEGEVDPDNLRVYATDGSMFYDVAPGNYQTSLGFKENVVGDVQLIEKVVHIATSLKNKEIGRCKFGNLGSECAFNVTNNEVKDMTKLEEDALPGVFRTFCNGKGLVNQEGEITEDCINIGLESGDKTVQARAKLARAFTTMRRNEDLLTFDFFESVIQNLNKKIKEETQMGNKKNKKTTTDQGVPDSNMPAEFTNEHGKELQGCMESGKTKDECLPTLARQDRDNKRDQEYINDKSPTVKMPASADTHNISKDAIEAIFKELKEMRTENAKLKEDFAPYLQDVELKKEIELKTFKEKLTKDFKMCPTKVDAMDYEAAKNAVEYFESSRLVQDAVNARDPFYTPPSVLDMATDDAKPKPNQFDWMGNLD